MAARKYLGGLVAVVVAFAVAPALAVSDAERVEVYKQFLTEFQAKRYVEAQPLAERLVKLTEEQYGPEELQLANPLTNLATIHYKLGNYPAAIENYQRTLRIMQAKSTIADKQQIRPLHGLGVSFLKAGEPESAVVVLKRAADLSRNNDGLYNLGQVEFIDALIEAYDATGRFVESEKEAGYALRVEEAAYGRSSVKLLDRLDKLARWFEADRRYSSERNIYERSLGILQRGSAPNDLRRIAPLRGIARSYRLESFYGAEGADTGAGFNSSNPGAAVFADGTQQRRGEAALISALELIDSTQPVDHLLRGQVLTDLGDWYLVINSTRRAYDTYADAWKSLSEANDTKLLEWPRVLAYRPSISSIDRSQLDPKEAQLRTVELHFTVTRDGRLENVSSPTTDVPEGIVRNSVTSMRRSRYAPRIENGAAVATNDVVFIEHVLIRAPTESAPTSGKAAEKPPEPPAAEPAATEPGKSPEAAK